jgi:hypothetical protein
LRSSHATCGTAADDSSWLAENPGRSYGDAILASRGARRPCPRYSPGLARSTRTAHIPALAREWGMEIRFSGSPASLQPTPSSPIASRHRQGLWKTAVYLRCFVLRRHRRRSMQPHSRVRKLCSVEAKRLYFREYFIFSSFLASILQLDRCAPRVSVVVSQRWLQRTR